jgi:DNA-binding GntR family transcriptional regulator
LTDTTRHAPIRRTRLSDEVAHRLREAILTGSLKPGMRVVQEQWARQLGVSRMPIRDAMTKLAAEGLVEISPTNETTVSSLSEQDMNDAYLLNAVLTGIAAQRAAERITPEQLASMRAVHAAMAEAVERGDAEAAQELNFRFHQELNQACGSQRMLTALRVVSAGIPNFALREIPEWRGRAVEDHAAILQAVGEHDGARARAAMEAHLLALNRLVVEHLRRQGFFTED